jgi:hypothetical protein
MHKFLIEAPCIYIENMKLHVENCTDLLWIASGVFAEFINL